MHNNPLHTTLTPPSKPKSLLKSPRSGKTPETKPMQNSLRVSTRKRTPPTPAEPLNARRNITEERNTPIHKISGARLCETYPDTADGKSYNASPDGGRFGNSVVTGKSAEG